MAEFDSHARQRETMVDCQVRPAYVTDLRVTGAMRALPRESFAPPGTNPYADADLPLGNGRFLFNPTLTGRLAQLVLSGNPPHVLVLAAGSGYLAAILAAAGVQVVALEEEERLRTGAALPPGAEEATGPLAAGWPAGGPYDAIVIEGAVPAIPPLLAAQLAPGGYIVAVLADDGVEGGIGRAVVAEPSGSGYAVVKKFDCTARLLPQFRLAPAFSL